MGQEAVRRTGARGELTVLPRPHGPKHILVAILSKPGGTELASMGDAQVLLQTTGMMVRGVETFGNYKIARQVWWCVPCEPGECSEDAYDLLHSRDPVTGSVLPPQSS